MKKLFIFLAVVAMIIAPAIGFGQITRQIRNLEHPVIFIYQQEGVVKKLQKEHRYKSADYSEIEEKNSKLDSVLYSLIASLIIKTEREIEKYNSTQESIKIILATDSLAKVNNLEGLSDFEMMNNKKKLDEYRKIVLEYEEELVSLKNDLKDVKLKLDNVKKQKENE